MVKQVYQVHWYGGGAAPLERTLQACPENGFSLAMRPVFWRYISGDADTDPANIPAWTYYARRSST